MGGSLDLVKYEAIPISGIISTAMFNLFALVLLCISAISVWRFVKRTKRPPYPPGPKPLPLVGNIFHIPAVQQWKVYMEWAKQYGSIVHVRAFHQHVIILNTVETATDLLEKRSANYSDRPDIPVLKMTGWDFTTPFMRYGDSWRKHRRMFHQRYCPESSTTYNSLQLSKARELLLNLYKNPGGAAMCIQHYTADLLMQITYGHQITPKDDHIVKLHEEAAKMINVLMTPGAQILNYFPILQRLPSWFPGGDFRKLCQISCMKVAEMKDIPFDTVRANMTAGTALPSLAHEFLEKNDSQGGGAEYEKVISCVAATSFAAGSDTTDAAILVFVLKMILYPDIQKRAQDHIDDVVGRDRLPGFEDRSSLPYIDALYQELMRHQPITPLAFPHSAVEDDIYNGYLIPKGATVIANVWAMTHDERVYPEPDKFMPERFLAHDGSLRSNSVPLTFGFGRRICVGRHFADATVWIAIASILSAFTISKAKDDITGQEIDVSEVYSEGITSRALPFPCLIKPRFEDAEKLFEDGETHCLY